MTVAHLKDNMYSIAALFAATTLLLSVIILPISFYNYYLEDLHNKTIIELTSKGVDPTASRCTFAPDSDKICMAYILTKTKS